MRGTLLNTATVACGALIGLAAGKAIPATYMDVTIHGLGLVTIGIGIKIFLQSKNVVAIAAAIAIGGLIGLLLGIQPGIEAFAAWAKARTGSTAGTFNEGLITTSVLYCIGPMTLMGCIQDGLEGKIELLSIKSTMDGISAIFFAAALGSGVLVTALVVLVFQGALTLAARPLKRFADDEELILETSAAGGIMLMGIGAGLVGIKGLQMAVYVPALIVMPLLVVIFRKFGRTQKPQVG